MLVKKVWGHFHTCMSRDFVTFTGRASRQEFWSFIVVSTVLSILLASLDIWVFKRPLNSLLSFNAVFSFITLMPSIAVGIRRIHDTGKGYFFIISYLLFAAPAICNVFNTNFSRIILEGSNLTNLLLAAFGAAAIASFYVLLQKGEIGPNKQGPDPLLSTDNEIDQIGKE
jgi:uncharacterized membrane protein YhaH (DUF805 family)